MRIDLTIAEPGGSRDVAVYAPEGSHFAAVAPALFGADAVACWADGVPLDPATPIGGALLRNGAVLSRRPPDIVDAAAATLRLHVVGGPAAGQSFPLAPGTATIGRSADCDIVLNDPAVSRHHVQLSVTAGRVRVTDLSSTHGAQIEGVLVPPHGDLVLPPGRLMRIGDSYLAVRDRLDRAAATHAGADGTVQVNRPPYPRRPEPIREIPVPDDGPRTPLQRIQWLATLLPAAGGVVLALVLRMPQLLAFAALSPVLALASGLGDRWHARRHRRAGAATMRRRRREFDAAVTRALDEEVRWRRDARPDPADVSDVARGPGTRLWRNKRTAELLEVRLGLGGCASSSRIVRAGRAEPAGSLAGIPVTADLCEGPLGIAAPVVLRTSVARWLVAQLGVFCSPGDVEIALVASDEATAARWEWLRWLPHWRGRLAADEPSRLELLTELAALIEQRRRTRSVDGQWAGSWLVIVIDGCGEVSARSAVHSILADGPQVGVTAVCLDSRTARLPPTCATVATACGDTGARLRLRYGGQPDRIAIGDQVDAAWADGTARALAPLVDAGADRSAGLPDRCELWELLELGDGEPGSIAARWKRSGGRALTVLGVGDNQPIAVDFDRDGPHVLVAGTTGAGKSELLQSLIIGLAVHSPPDEINFILVDYKGGAAFADCARLPHTVGLVTDLDAHLTRRALTSLDSELRRRERLFAVAGVSDFAGYRTQPRDSPIARLVLVVDEFATLAEELPEFIGGLVGIAQRGRSLGVHLVLATQRPGGAVSPEIRANTALRIALRITDAAESTDVIGVDDAARIPRDLQGRAYMRVGTSVVALQTAYVGGKVRRRDDAIVAVPLDEWRRPRFSDRERAEVGPTDLDRLVELIQVAADHSGAAAVRRRPWLDPLPVDIRLPEPIPVDVARTGLVSRDTSAADQARAPATVDIGIADHPEEQSQPRVQLDLTAGDSWLFAGAPRSGRTTALTTVAMQAAAAVPPQYLHIYGIEADGGLAGLADLPHCGTVARCDDPVVLDGLLRRLAQWVTQRQAQLVSDGFGSTAQAWRVGTRLPVSLLLLDGWEAFVAAADELDGGQSVATLIGLLRSGPAVGLTVVIAGGRGALSPRPAASVTRRYLLRLADRSDYGLAGLPAPLVPQRMPPGRAIQAPDGVEIQVAAGTANRPARRSGTGYGASRPTAGPPRCPKLPATAPRSSSDRYHSWFDLPISPASRERSPSA